MTEDTRSAVSDACRCALDEGIVYTSRQLPLLNMKTDKEAR